MKLLGKLTQLIPIAFFAQQVQAQEIFVSTSDDCIYRLNIENCSYQKVCQVDRQMYDITFHPDGRLFGISGDGTLFIIDTVDGSSQVIHQFSDFWLNFNSLVASADGIIYAAGTYVSLDTSVSSTGGLWSLNLDGTNATYHGEFQFGATGDLTFYNGGLYVAVIGDRILLLDFDDLWNSEIALSEDINRNIYGIVSYAESCSDIKSYIITDSLSEIHLIRFNEMSLEFICALDIMVWGGASTYEFLGSAPINIHNIVLVHPACGEDDGVIEIQASGGIGTLSYAINDGPIVDAGYFDGLNAGKYILTIADEVGCVVSEEIDLNQMRVLIINIIEQMDATCVGNNGMVSASVLGAIGSVNYSIDGQIFSADSVFATLAPGNYTIQAFDEDGCEVDTTVTINQEDCMIFLPNVFSPNDDGVNDLFGPIARYGFGSEFLELSIFDRWGNLLHKENSTGLELQQVHWDGSMGGQQMNPGVYLYLLKIQHEGGEIEFIADDFTLIR